jgi:hypothetical protein
MLKRVHRDRAGSGNVKGRVATAALSASVALGLLFLGSGLRPAQAIDVNLGGTDASLVFNPTFLGLDQVGYLCAFNLNQATSVTVELVFDSVTFGDHVTQTAQLPPRGEACAPRSGVSNLSDFIAASVVLHAPTDCSQAVDYPGKCGITASLEVAEQDPTAQGAFPGKTNRIHLDPVLVHGLPGPPRINPVRLPQ